MFRTPTSASPRGGVRRPLLTAGSSGGQTNGNDQEDPVGSEGSSSNEVLSILRSLQQQVSTLQAQQASQTQQAVQPQADASPSSSRSATSTPGSVKRRLPKDLVVSSSIFVSPMYVMFASSLPYIR